jgi:hypothetical protein
MVLLNLTPHIKVKPELAKGLKGLARKRETDDEFLFTDSWHR